jgi:hypothetical protein
MPQPIFLTLFMVGAAVDALWLVIRFPSFGPHSMKTAGIVMFSGMAALGAVAPLLAVARLLPIPHAAFVAAFAVGFSAFVYLFLGGLWFVRVMHGMLDGLTR